MFTPVMPMPQSFFSTSVALTPMPRARSATVIVSSMRMTRLCSAGVGDLGRLLALLAEGQLLATEVVAWTRATTRTTGRPPRCCCCAKRPRIGLPAARPAADDRPTGVRSVILMRGGSAMTVPTAGRDGSRDSAATAVARCRLLGRPRRRASAAARVSRGALRPTGARARSSSASKRERRVGRTS